MDSQLVGAVLGASIVALSTVLVQWISLRRDSARWDEQNKREAQARVYEHRRAAIEGFITTFNSLWDKTLEMRYGGPDPSAFEDALAPLWEKKLTLTLYAGREVRSTAETAYKALDDLVYRPKTVVNVQQALDGLIDAARRELAET